MKREAGGFPFLCICLGFFQTKDRLLNIEKNLLHLYVASMLWHNLYG